MKKSHAGFSRFAFTALTVCPFFPLSRLSFASLHSSCHFFIRPSLCPLLFFLFPFPFSFFSKFVLILYLVVSSTHTSVNPVFHVVIYRWDHGVFYLINYFFRPNLPVNARWIDFFFNPFYFIFTTISQKNATRHCHALYGIIVVSCYIYNAETTKKAEASFLRVVDMRVSTTSM